MIRPIVTNKEKLAIPSEPILSPITADVIISDMLDTAKHYQSKPIGCMGLAANQIGYLYRIILVFHAQEWNVMINPEVELIPGKSKYMRESCLSRPGVNAKLKRHKNVRVRYSSDSISTNVLSLIPGIERKFTGLAARIIQHEVDHLDGIYI